MASYRPSKELQVVKPCGERWEDMPGDSRVRHCGVCERDVLNTAAMTPKQIEDLISRTEPAPCLRLVPMGDGMLMTAHSEPRLSFLQRSSLALSTVILAATSAAAQDIHPSRAQQNAILQGIIVDREGVPIPHVTVELRENQQKLVAVETGADGAFSLQAHPGDFQLNAAAPGFFNFLPHEVTLTKGVRELAHPIRLEVAVMGEIEVVRSKPLKTKKVASSRGTPAPSATPAPR